MLDKQIGFMLCETAPTEKQEATVVSDKGNRCIIETCLIDTDVKNRNGRY